MSDWFGISLTVLLLAFNAFFVGAEFALIAAREEDHLTGLVDQVAPAPVVRVPYLRTDVHDLESLAIIGDHLFDGADR